MTQAARCTVLLVEDEPIIGYELEHELSNAGYHVIGPARTLKHALELIETSFIDLAVIDLGLADGASDVAVSRLLSPLAVEGVNAFVDGERNERGTIRRRQRARGEKLAERSANLG